MIGAEYEEMVPLPASGRVFEATRRVRLGDASPAARLRLDSCARYLQDIANDDSRNVGSANPTAWVARRTVLRVERFPEYLDLLTVRTWCSALGPRWAERRYSMVAGDSASGGHIEAATLWVHIDMATMKPIEVPADFVAQFGEASRGRTIGARLHLPTRPVGDVQGTETWPVRFVDFDVLGHVNNAVYWSIVEEHLARRRDVRAPMTITLDHRDAVDPGAEMSVTVAATEHGFDLWVTTTGGRVAAVIRASID